ncbi:MAG TPA: ABC transporter ATP-binding protein/permease, partial [Chromatiales bacterium]|nr:ABC transporter ATP-binding protein/permease [Chromatiales bacterium]
MVHGVSSRTEQPHITASDLRNLRRMGPYLWRYRGRVLVALSCLILAKLATVGAPLVLKQIVDALDASRHAVLVVPLGLLAGYGMLRVAMSLFSELRDTLFARVRYAAMHQLSVQVLEHLHELSLRYHLERRTGAISRDLDRGARSISSILNYLVFNILPTIAELALVAFVLLHQYAWTFALVTLLTVGIYVAFTLAVTNWRMHFRHTMNALDSRANGQAVDSLLNYETVKYFNNERFEVQRYDRTLRDWEDAAVKSQATMSMLNAGQGLIIAAGVTGIMVLAARGVAAGRMSLGDLVLVNTMMLQLFLPLNFLGVIYRSLNYALADMLQVFQLLDRQPEIRDRPDARPLEVTRAEVRFEDVVFGYQPGRRI